MVDTIIHHLREHASRELVFEPGILRAKRLPTYKQFVEQEMEMIRHERQRLKSGRETCLARSALADTLIQHLFQYALNEYPVKHGVAIPCEVAVIGLGGYGREELSPHSDVDLMFLYPNLKKTPEIEALQQIVIDQILYILWDLGWKVGHATRTIREAMKEARGDIQTKNALLESRYICGSETLAQNFQKKYQDFCRRDAPQKYIESRLIDQEQRRQHYGNTVFIQEPDIKNGVGGLRDLQNLIWMSGIKLGISSWLELENKQYLSRNERLQIEGCYDFLLRVRNELHFSRKRPTDILDLEAQPEIGWQLGYHQPDIFVRVEAFMRDYYHNAITVFRLSRVLEKRLALLPVSRLDKLSQQATSVVTKKWKKQIIHDGFLFDGREITSQRPEVFQTSPERLIRVFRHLQMWNGKLSLELESQIREALQQVEPEELQTPDCQRTMLAILQSAGQVYPALFAMYDTGVLECYMPEFKRLNCLVQHEYYHRYTADFHTLSTIHELDKIFQAKAPPRLLYLDQIRQVAAPWLLYPTLLLHDIGKGWGIKGHAETGVRVAKPILQKMGLNKEQIEISLFLIKNHLEMARFWQKYDIDDPQTITSFAQIMENPENLRMLFALTYCDANGTSSDLWNDYKNALHYHLFEATLETLTVESFPQETPHLRKSATYQSLLSTPLHGIPIEEVEAHYTMLPESYFFQTSEEEIILHLKLVHKLLESLMRAESLETLRPVIDWHDDVAQGYTLMNVVTWNRSGLFFKLAGALSVAGVNILSARAYARKDNITIDTFVVTKPGGGVVDDPRIPEIFRDTLSQCLIENFDPWPLIVAQGKKHQRTFRRMDPLRTALPPRVSVYTMPSLQKNIVEVQANDQIGLLYQIARTLSAHRFEITYARISTELGRAVDTFYIEPGDLFGERVLEEEMAHLEIALKEQIQKNSVP